MADVNASPGLTAGSRVEVRSRFDRHWVRGFEVASVEEDGRFVIRRLSDRTELPDVFDADEVRAERRRPGLWWY